MFRKIVIFLVVLNFCSTQNCTFQLSKITANWNLENSGSSLKINFTNSYLENDHWTAVAFGKSMQDLSVIIFENNNYQISVRTGITTGYGPPTLDANSQVTQSQISYSGFVLNAVVSIPTQKFNGFDLTDCQTWNFVESGPIRNGRIARHTYAPTSVDNVCPKTC
ncbi:unnamed protein product [Caenorhabditis angaria]|uniref:DOMON domain-containing protein n=1 Tax=Caenorhabditis angaria TaxID=860376 RepID=A0A9P1I476_9PELO|nr:unnamed protein product [Caenorhabditis angaria]